jgi:tRNA 2-thiouridine synthesizing protein A
MQDRVDARGLSCPQPVLMALSKMREMKSGNLEILVDNEVSKENICRAAAKEGWIIKDLREESDEYSLLFTKS